MTSTTPHLHRRHPQFRPPPRAEPGVADVRAPARSSRCSDRTAPASRRCCRSPRRCSSRSSGAGALRRAHRARMEARRCGRRIGLLATISISIRSCRPRRTCVSSPSSTASPTGDARRTPRSTRADLASAARRSGVGVLARHAAAPGARAGAAARAAAGAARRAVHRPGRRCVGVVTSDAPAQLRQPAARSSC